jgi:exodeoxyribonuclease VII large subunit
MQQSSLFPITSLTVSDISRYLRELMDSDEILSDVWVKGEISNLSRPSSGHIYFSLKDAASALKCVVWKMTAGRLPLSLQSGMEIEAHGAVSVYERDGQYQLYVDAVRLSGEGTLYQEFLRLKARLEAEGLFDQDRKRALPEIPQRIGIVSSPTGAALQDILNTLRRRFPLVKVIISPTPVQGDEAPPEIVKAINLVNAGEGVDVMLVERGGGSLEDLWAFNDERVVRAIGNSRAPVITGIGHETDFTLSDFAADRRAPTPTAAAEMATPDAAELGEALGTVMSRMGYAFQTVVASARVLITQDANRLERVSPLFQVRNDRQRLDDLGSRMELALQNDFKVHHSELKGAQNRLFSLNPFSVLQRGYAIVTDAQGRVVNSVQQVHKEDILDVKVVDGVILTRVLSEPQAQINGDGSNVKNK